MRLPPPNPLTTICIWIAAIFIAIREGAEKTHSLPSLVNAMSGGWSYLPVGVMTLAAVIYLINLLRQPAAGREPFTSSYTAPPESRTTEIPTVGNVAPPESSLKESAKDHSVTPPESVGPREYLPDSFAKRYLELMASNHTKAQEAALLRPQVGKWIRIKATVVDVMQYPKVARMHLSYTFRKQYGSGIFVTFDGSWNDQLALLKPGENVRCAARIKDSAYGSPEFCDAELL